MSACDFVAKIIIQQLKNDTRKHVFPDRGFEIKG